jgi:hypothetical protein
MPNINGTDREQLAQIRSYLYQLIPQLQWALSNATVPQNYIAPQAQRSTAVASTSFDTETAFDALKPLIIKSADIVTAFYEEINTRLEGMYAAKSDFGTFTEQTSQSISQNSTEIEQCFSDLQQIVTDIATLNFTLAEVNAHIRTGLLYYDGGIPVYGLEIGQKNNVDGEEVFNKFARFTADRLSFYDQNDTEVAYISDYKLYITDVQIKGSLQEGGYKDFVDANGGIITRWVGW